MKQQQQHEEHRHQTLRWPPEPSSGPSPERESRPLVAERYELHEPLGMGGMSTVFAAQDTLRGRPVAVKVLHRAIGDDPDVLLRFQREVGVGSIVGHPSIVEVLDSGVTEEGSPFLVMELLEGESLSQRLTQGPLPPKAAVGVALQVLSALQAAHERGIIHRDLKPDNVFLCGQGAVKVLDFGIAKLDDVMHSAFRSLSGDLVVGTPSYMSPEQAAGRAVDARTDVYAVGALLYEMLCGEPPYVGDPYVIMSSIVSRDPIALARRAPEMSLALCAVVERAMARDLHKRTPSAVQMIDALEPFLIAPTDVVESRPIPLVRRRLSAFPPPEEELPVRWHPWRWVAGLAALAAIVLFLVPEWGEGIAAVAEKTFAPVPAVRAPRVSEPAQTVAVQPLDPRISVAPPALPSGLAPEEAPGAADTVPPEQAALPAEEPAQVAPEMPAPRRRARFRRARPGILPGVPYQPLPPREGAAFGYEPPPPTLSSEPAPQQEPDPEPTPGAGQVVPFEERDIWGTPTRPQPPVPHNPYTDEDE